MTVDFTEISFVVQLFFVYCIEKIIVGNGHFWFQDPSWRGRSAKVAQFDLQGPNMIEL